MTYQVHPETCFYGVELRDGESIDSYIATARGFNSTAEFREYRDASPKRQAEIRSRQRDNNNSADSGDEDRRRAYEFLTLDNQ